MRRPFLFRHFSINRITALPQGCIKSRIVAFENADTVLVILWFLVDCGGVERSTRKGTETKHARAERFANLTKNGYRHLFHAPRSTASYLRTACSSWLFQSALLFRVFICNPQLSMRVQSPSPLHLRALCCCCCFLIELMLQGHVNKEMRQ